MSDEYTCEECDRSFDSERGLHIHQGRVHDIHHDADQEDAADTNAAEERETGVVAREEDGRVSVSMSVFHALGVTFVLGIIFGGFVMGAAAQVTHGTGLTGDQTSQLLQQLQEAEAGSQGTADPQQGTQGTQDTGSGDAGSNRVMLTSDMLADEPTLGSSDAPVTIVEYSDFACPWCAEWAGFDEIPQRPIDGEESLDKIVSNYVDSGDVRFVFKDYPRHRNAPQAHVAANCVLEQDEELYWDYHDDLFNTSSQWKYREQNRPDETFKNVARNLEVDFSAFETCYDEDDRSEIQEDKSGIDQLDGRLGTPTFFIGNTEDGFVKVEGAQPYSGLKTLIDSQLQDAS